MPLDSEQADDATLQGNGTFIEQYLAVFFRMVFEGPSNGMTLSPMFREGTPLNSLNGADIGHWRHAAYAVLPPSAGARNEIRLVP